MTQAASHLDAGGQPSPVAGLRIAIANWRDPWHPDAGGAERYAYQMALGLQARGARVTFLTARPAGQAGRARHDGVDIVRRGGRFGVYPRILWWLARHRRSFDAVLDCHCGIPFFTPWVLPADVPVLCILHHVHDAQFGVHFPAPVAAIGRVLEGPLSRWTYRRHEAVAVSESTARAMRRRLHWRGPIHVVHNGLPEDAGVVAAAAARPAQDRTTLPGAAAAVTLTWVGRLSWHKRVERVIDVAARLASTGVTIEVIGRGPAGDPLASQIAARNLGGAVKMRGFLPEEEKKAVLAGSLLHLNTSQGEGWGLCVLEAAALGVPTVGYDVDGLRDAVRDGETGWLVRAGERIEDVTERAVKELADPVRRAQVAQACRAWAGQFDWDRSAAVMAGLVGDAVRMRAGRLRGRRLRGRRLRGRRSRRAVRTGVRSGTS
jgi:glycosyltransferase involved in cell wall biosynthesis